MSTMASKPVPLTKQGLDKLQKKLDYLQTVRRAEVAQRIHDASAAWYPRLRQSTAHGGRRTTTSA